MPEKEKVSDQELQLLERLVKISEQFQSELEQITEEAQYKRVREYINNRFVVEMPYNSPFVKEEKK